MKSAELKLEMFRKIDSLETNKLKELYGIMINYLNSNKESDEWLNVTDNEKKSIEIAIEQLDCGKGIPHSEVINRLRNKYSNV